MIDSLIDRWRGLRRFIFIRTLRATRGSSDPWITATIYFRVFDLDWKTNMAESTNVSNENDTTQQYESGAGDEYGSSSEELSQETQGLIQEYADSLREFGRKLVAAARRNPVPASLIAVAAGYLVGRMTRRYT